MAFTVEREIGGRTLTIETGKIARQAAGAVMVRYGGTMVIAAAIAVHRELGPGLLESVYEIALAKELTDRGLRVARQVPVRIEYKGIAFDEGFRADILVEDKVGNLVVRLAQLTKDGKDSVCQGTRTLDKVQLATA